jgi:hypothetical protein
VKLVEYTGDGGNAIRLLFMDCDQPKYDTESFLEEIEISRPEDYSQLIALFDKAKKYGIVPNAQKTKPLHGKHARPLWEFCARGGSRVFWFFDKNNNSIVICTHGFIAKKSHEHTKDIERAQERRDLYYRAKPIPGAMDKHSTQPKA